MKNAVYIFKYFCLLFFFIINQQIVVLAETQNIFRTLKSEIVFVRQGHDLEYPIKFVYKKKYLPVMILDSWENFKKIKDYNNNTGWIHISKLSKRKAAINTKNNSIIFKKPTIYSKPIARAEKGRLVIIKKCNKFWCKVKSEQYTGWMKKNILWGKI